MFGLIAVLLGLILLALISKRAAVNVLSWSAGCLAVLLVLGVAFGTGMSAHYYLLGRRAGEVISALGGVAAGAAVIYATGWALTSIIRTLFPAWYEETVFQHERMQRLRKLVRLGQRYRGSLIQEVLAEAGPALSVKPGRWAHEEEYVIMTQDVGERLTLFVDEGTKEVLDFELPPHLKK